LLRTKRMQLRNHADSKTMKRSLGWKGYAIYTYNTKFGLLEVRDNEISLRTLCSGTRQLRTLEGTLALGLRLEGRSPPKHPRSDGAESAWTAN